MMMDTATTLDLVGRLWRNEIEPQLRDYIAIPALSPAFEPQWAAVGHIGAAVDQISSWMNGRLIAGLTVEVRQLPERTPLIVAEIPPFGVDEASAPTVVLYGHLDKQPEMLPWREGLDPWTPVREGERLYGRGGADDGTRPSPPSPPLRPYRNQEGPMVDVLY